MLRALLLLVVVMNLGVSAWWAWHRPSPPPRWTMTDGATPSLALVGETAAARIEAANPAEAVVEELGENPVCLTLGPIESSAELRRVMTALTPHVGRIQYREEPATRLRGYRVFLPASGSRSQALETARSLAARGINDYYVVTAGDQQNTVSLGIFRELENAQRRQQQVAELGYQASVETRTEQGSQWWVDIAAPVGFDWARRLPGTALTAQNVQCP